MTAICAVCGLTDIRKRTAKGTKYYICRNRERLHGRKYGRNAYTPRISNPLHHSLSNIDEKNKTAICSICGLVQIYYVVGQKKNGSALQ